MKVNTFREKNRAVCRYMFLLNLCEASSIVEDGILMNGCADKPMVIQAPHGVNAMQLGAVGEPEYPNERVGGGDYRFVRRLFRIAFSMVLHQLILITAPDVVVAWLDTWRCFHPLIGGVGILVLLGRQRGSVVPLCPGR